MEYYLAIEKKEILKFTTTSMNLEDSIWRETSQTEKDKYCVILLLYKSKKVELIEPELW